MRCLDPEACACLCHVSPTTHVPTCPLHGAPLAASRKEPGRGFCPECFARGVHAHVKPALWRWTPREVFNGSDLPPHNGWRALDLTDEGEVRT